MALASGSGRAESVVPAAALHTLATKAAESGGCVDVAAMAAQRRTAREVARMKGGAPW